MTTRYAQMMTSAYGPFWPGSAARELRHRNADRGLRTCYLASCLMAYDPAKVGHRAAPRNSRRSPWWEWYHSRECAVLDGYVRDRSPAVYVLDLRGCRGCAA